MNYNLSNNASMNIDESNMNNSDPHANNWSPDSWRTRAALQQPNYPDLAALEGVQNELALLPPLGVLFLQPE